VFYSGRVIAEACSFGAGRSGSQAYLHLHYLVQTFPWKIFLAAFNRISDSNHAPGYTILAVGLTNDASDQTDWNL
jgi:hypothetical protein